MKKLLMAGAMLLASLPVAQGATVYMNVNGGR